MSRPDGLFREEAVREYIRTRMQGRLLAISPRWTSWAWWLLLAMTLSALTFASLAKVDRWVEGSAVITRDGALVAVFAADAPALPAEGAELRVQFAGNATAPVLTLHPGILGPGNFDEQWPRLEGLLPVDGPVIVLEARAPAGTSQGESGTVAWLASRSTILETVFGSWF